MNVVFKNEVTDIGSLLPELWTVLNFEFLTFLV